MTIIPCSHQGITGKEGSPPQKKKKKLNYLRPSMEISINSPSKYHLLIYHLLGITWMDGLSASSVLLVSSGIFSLSVFSPDQNLQ